MNKKLGIVAVFTWIGFVGAISFMEAWLKFRAPGVTLPIGLGIGRLVFAALNKVEWVLLIGILVSVTFKGMARPTKVSLILAGIILVLQTLWLLPALDTRAELYISGASVPPSNIHLYYVAAEGIKMMALIVLGIGLLTEKKL